MVVKWIGCVLPIDGGKIQVNIPEEKIAELGHVTEKFLKNNVVAIPELRSHLGKAFVWRPFLSEVWAALTAAASTRPHKTLYEPSKYNTASGGFDLR